MLGSDYSALDIENGQELLRFDLGTVRIGRQDYTVLTGYEGTGRCFWCGGELKGKLKSYCYGHGKLYYRHFEWGNAKWEALQRSGNRCENCGAAEEYRGYYMITSLEVHHIVPLNGGPRGFSAYNLPWNLVVLCHECHLEIHAAMIPPKEKKSTYKEMLSKGQIPMELAHSL